MVSIIEELYNENLYPSARIVSKDPNYRASSHKINAAMDEWKSKLTKEDYDKLLELVDLHHSMHDMDSTASFAYGFKLGASIMMEVFNGKGDLVLPCHERIE
ncbi:DUF6809 family protein [Cohnella silvisoli]|uniref:Uncharacterized protein n=1 Tax=Cohnella silvisoli TaxID=2873699 RepID=A0ABV1KQP3_9BACL|nr:DUF6809 family protein [Cohnella silvisoli]MCD9024664.1 hypothetical protein [Cohnella silvisoli]